MLLSLLRGEFLPSRTKSVLTDALALALVTFACLSFGQTSTGNNQGTASLYVYFRLHGRHLAARPQAPAQRSPGLDRRAAPPPPGEPPQTPAPPSPPPARRGPPG